MDLGNRIDIKEELAMDEICRTCTLNFESEFLIPIFKHNPNLEFPVYNIIKYFFNFQIEILEDDYLPQNICRNCYSKFVEFKKFLDKCIEAHNSLIEYVEKSKPIIETFLIHKTEINTKDSKNIIIEKSNETENDFLDTRIENQTISVPSLHFIKKEDHQLNSAVRDHDYQDISLDIIEENSENFDDNSSVEMLEQDTNIDEYENDDTMKIDYISESEFQAFEEENIALLDCNYCKYAFSVENLDEHLKEYHPSESPFLCTKCFRNFRTQGIRDKHELLNMCQINERKLQEFQSNAVEIVVAEEDFYDSRELESDDEYIQENEIKQVQFEIEDTDTVSSEINKNSTVDNSNINDEDNCEEIPLKCPICNEGFTKTKTFSDHIKRDHPDFDKKLIRSKYACEICDRDCKTKQSLESHLNSHRGVKPFICEICKTSFFGSKALRTHINNDHSSIQFNCKICGKDFSKKTVYITHMSNHKKDNDPNRKPDIKYKCQFCPRTFNTVSTLTIHSLTHKKLLDSKHICNVCGVTFKRADHLKMHMYGVHLDHKPFPCEQCDKSFPTAWQRNTHVKKYHSAEKKKYKCEQCPNEYASSNALKRHYMVHTGELKYSCDVCEQKFSKIFLLEEHLKTHEIDENQRQESINEVYMEIAKSVIIPN